MRVSIEPQGADVELVTRKLVREVEQANRGVCKDIAKVGKKAIIDDTRRRRGNMRFGTGTLSVKTKVEASPTDSTVTFQGVSVGAWVIQETGAKPHQIKPRNRKALHWGGGDSFSEMVSHPGVRGRHLWSAAQPALDEAVGKVIEDAFDEAVGS